MARGRIPSAPEKFFNNFSEMKEDNLPDDFEDFEEDESSEPDYYLCNACGYTCTTNYGLAGCPKCTAIMEEQFY